MKDQIDGGLADDLRPSDFNTDQLANGVKMEMGEHTNDPSIAAEIAMDHLVKHPDDYQEDEEGAKEDYSKNSQEVFAGYASLDEFLNKVGSKLVP